MGFDLAQVISDEKHYIAFTCEICKNLVSLDAVVTRCAHPFCPECLEAWFDHQQNLQQESDDGENDVEIDSCPCPACQREIITSPEDAYSMMLGVSIALAVQPLQKAQPLAYLVLENVQVACIDRSNRANCEWSGDYAEFIEHAASHGEDCACHSFVSVTATATIEKSPSFVSTDKSNEPSLFEFEGDDDDDMLECSVPGSPERLQQGGSTQRKGLSMADVGEEQRKLKESLEEMNGTAAQRERDAPPNMVQRTFSEDGSFAGGDIRFGGKMSNNRTKKRTKATSNADDRDNDLEMSACLNTSISSFGNMNNSFRDQTPLETLEEGESNDVALELEQEGKGLAQVEKMKKVMDKAEKLKKQANAKFNKGDFASARTLYTDGINAMSSITAVNAQERDLLSNMHSNRAVTYFREKKFEECIHDCDKAIGYDPHYDKSWIRKWRALMGLGSFDKAYDCLQKASQTIPDSKRIVDELTKSSGDKKIIDEARDFLAKGDYQKARDLLKPSSRNSDNLGLLMLAAKADAGVGYTESALEKVNRALRFNPQNTEGLEVRGHILFLTGETEKGAHLLQEAYGRNRDNRSVRLELMRCQKTHSALSKGRSCVKRGRYAEALEHFTNAIKESGKVPPQAPLYGELRTERAEAFLLSKKYIEALKDCDEVLNSQQENATAWSVRAEILIALGKAEEAKRELERIRCTWGADNPTIDEGYRRVDFELRVLKEDDALMKFVEDLQSGQPERLPFGLFDQKRKSSREPNPHHDRRLCNKGANRPNDRRNHPEATRRRASGDRERHRSKSRPKNHKREHENGRSVERVERTRSGESGKGSFVHPPSIEDSTNGFHGDVDRRTISGKENKRRPASERGTQDVRRRSRSQSVKRT